MDYIITSIEHSEGKKQIKKLKGEVNRERQTVGDLEKTIAELQILVEEKDKLLAAAPAATAPAAVSPRAEPVQAAVVSDPEPVVNRMSPAEYTAHEKERQETLDQLEALIAKLSNLNTSLPVAVETCDKDTALKIETKNDIKIWMKNFEKENGNRLSVPRCYDELR
jgi:DNA repair exonuclease SbcCD ATPase subunit